MMAWYNISAVPTLDRQLYTFTVPAGTAYTATVRPEKYNSRVLTITGPTTSVYTESNQAAQDGPVQACCGGCEITAWYVDIKFWPQSGADTRCLTMPTPVKTRGGIPWPTRVPDNAANIPIAYPTDDVARGPQVTPRALLPTLVKRDSGNGTGGSEVIAVEDGVTYTSPYLYVVYPSIWAEDRCGPHGGFYTSITWSFLPGQLSSLDSHGYTRVFNETELPCRRKGYWSDGLYHPATLAAVPQLNMLEPSYKNCFVGYWQGLDPPFAFSAKTDFFDTTTADPKPTLPPASPQSTHERVPQQTSNPNPPQNSGPNTSPKPDPKPDPKSEPQPESEPKAQPGSPVSQQAEPSSAPVHRFSSHPTVTQVPHTTPPPIVVGSHTVSVDHINSIVHIGSHTARLGKPVVISDTPISVAPGSIKAVVGPSTQQVVNQPAPEPIIAGGNTLHSSDGHFEVGGQTVEPGSPAITVQNTPISIAPGGASAVIGSSTVDLGSSSFQSPVLVAGQALKPTGEKFVIDGQTIAPGAPAITIHSTPISIPAGANSAVIGSSTIVLPEIVGANPLIGAQTLTPSGSNFVISGHTIHPGMPATTIKSTPYSIAADGSHAVIGTSTISLPPLVTPAPITIDGQTLTPKGSIYVASGTTITPGGLPATVDGTRISLASSGPSIYVGSKAYSLVQHLAQKTFQADGQTFTSLLDGGVVVASHTLHAGSPTITVSGTKISLGAEGSLSADSYVVIGTQTFDLAAPSNLPIQSIAGDKVTPLAGGKGVIISGTTYAPGDKFTAEGGQVVGVTSGGVILQSADATRTESSGAAETTEPGVGDYVVDGMGNGETGGLAKQGIATGTAASASATSTSGVEAVRVNRMLQMVLFGLVGFLV